MATTTTFGCPQFPVWLISTPRQRLKGTKRRYALQANVRSRREGCYGNSALN